MRNLDAFFKPKSVAIIGASHEPQKIGHVILKNFKESSSYKGKIFPINPDTKPILRLKTYASVKDIPQKIDLAIIAIPAKFVPKVLEECGQAKVKAVTIITGGFKEVGKDGEKLEKQLHEIISKYKIPVVGPNCLGILDTGSGVDMLFLPPYRLGRPKKGPIAFISQSGAFGSAILDWSAQEGFGVSKFISYGNAVDVDEVDLLEYLGKDSQTKVISIYLEGANRAREFMEVAKKVTRKKPVLIYKAGSSKVGTKAAQSHTGSLAGSQEIYSAAFKQSRVIQVETVEDMFDFARALSYQPLPKGNRIAIITDGGGFGVLAADHAEREGLEVVKPSPKTVKKIRNGTLPYASLHNPIDLTGSADGEMYRLAIEACMQDPKIDGIVVILLFQPPNIDSDVIQHILDLHSKYNKPLLVTSTGGAYTQLHRDILDQSGVPTFDTPSSAVRSMAALYKYSQLKKSKLK